jgi:hypothetical protein
MFSFMVVLGTSPTSPKELYWMDIGPVVDVHIDADTIDQECRHVARMLIQQLDTRPLALTSCHVLVLGDRSVPVEHFTPRQVFQPKLTTAHIHIKGMSESEAESEVDAVWFQSKYVLHGVVPFS